MRDYYVTSQLCAQQCKKKRNGTTEKLSYRRTGKNKSYLISHVDLFRFAYLQAVRFY